jgi:hypothetical protein
MEIRFPVLSALLNDYFHHPFFHFISIFGGMFVHRFIDVSYANESRTNNFTESTVNPFTERFRTEYFMGKNCEKNREASFHRLRNDLFRLSQNFCTENGVSMYTLR